MSLWGRNVRMLQVDDDRIERAAVDRDLVWSSSAPDLWDVVHIIPFLSISVFGRVGIIYDSCVTLCMVISAEVGV